VIGTSVTASRLLGVSLSLALLAACGERDEILPGERVDLRETPALVNQSLAVNIPAAQSNADWSHRNGDTDHLISHPALGGTRRARITAEPVVAGGVVFTLDARATVSATTTSGQRVWSRNLTPSRDRPSDASGGGISVADGQVYVATGFGMSPPTIVGDLAYVVARNSTALALDTTTGRIQWQVSSNPSTANFSGSAAPAVSDDIAVFPFPSGEVVGTFPQGGLRRWSVAITGDRLGRAAALVTDITSDPVIDGATVYVGNFGGRVVALNANNGDRIWTAAEGAISPVWPVGNALFLINDINQLVRLDAGNGQPVWRIDLPDTERTGRRRKEVVGHYGPVLAGGRLIVTSSDGFIRQYDPASGNLLGRVAIARGAASAPVIAGQTLYVVSKNGQLHAFR